MACDGLRHDVGMSATPPDFRLYHGNDLELLAGVLARELARPVEGRALLEPDTILIPQPAMRRWLQKTLAETHGIAANLRFLTPGEFVREALDGNVPGAGAASVGDAATLRWRLWALLADAEAMREAVFAPLRPVLGGADPGLAAWTLAGELADAFEKYQAWRRDWLRRWDHGGDRGDWQAELWRRATRQPEPSRQAARRLPVALRRRRPRCGRPACRNAAVRLRLPERVARRAARHRLERAVRDAAFFLSVPGGRLVGRPAERARTTAAPIRRRYSRTSENQLLRANGAAGRDFVRALFSDEVVQPADEFPLYVPPDPGSPARTCCIACSATCSHASPRRTPARQALPDFDCRACRPQPAGPRLPHPPARSAGAARPAARTCSESDSRRCSRATSPC